jgi:integral membrane protein
MKYQFLKLMALLEGTSLLLLIGIAMPLKYGLGYEQAVSVVGMAHGVLFLAFNAVLVYYAFRSPMNEMQAFKGFIASLIPAGTFVYKATVIKRLSQQDSF